MKIDVTKNSKKIIALVILISVVCVGILAIKGFYYGIDFSGGSLVQLQFKSNITLHQINENLDLLSDEMEQLQSTSRNVQVSDDNTIIIRTQELSTEETGKVLENLKKIGEFKVIKEEKVGSKIGGDLRKSAIYALGIGSLLILLYITFRFEFSFSLAAILGQTFDLLVSLTVISLLNYEINTPFIAAVLTILGYGINDTIIVFDRIRENFKRYPKTSIEENLNKSVNQVVVRSINTSVTTLLALLSIILFGGDSLKTFTVTLFTGIFVGTFTSLFVSSSFVYLLNKNKKKNDFKKISKKKEKHNEDKILV